MAQGETEDQSFPLLSLSLHSVIRSSCSKVSYRILNISGRKFNSKSLNLTIQQSFWFSYNNNYCCMLREWHLFINLPHYWGTCVFVRSFLFVKSKVIFRNTQIWHYWHFHTTDVNKLKNSCQPISIQIWICQWQIEWKMILLKTIFYLFLNFSNTKMSTMTTLCILKNI